MNSVGNFPQQSPVTTNGQRAAWRLVSSQAAIDIAAWPAVNETSAHYAMDEIANDPSMSLVPIIEAMHAPAEDDIAKRTERMRLVVRDHLAVSDRLDWVITACALRCDSEGLERLCGGRPAEMVAATEAFADEMVAQMLTDISDEQLLLWYTQRIRSICQRGKEIMATLIAQDGETWAKRLSAGSLDTSCATLHTPEFWYGYLVYAFDEVGEPVQETFAAYARKHLPAAAR